jgi:hypothetical protein
VFVTGANDKAALQVEIGKFFWEGERGRKRETNIFGKNKKV